MEKSVTINGKITSDSLSRNPSAEEVSEERKDHLKIWRDIYRDVRRQWADAESGRTGRYRYSR